MRPDPKTEFDLDENLMYLNHAGVSPWPLRTANAVRRFADENSSQGSVRYLKWAALEDDLRQKAALLMNAGSKDDIAILKSTSEALSTVAYGLSWKSGDNIVSSNQEFPSNRIVWESLADQGVEFREADLGSSMTPEDALFSLVDSRTRLITISSVQYATGLKMDLARIGSYCRERGILFCVDAIQSLGAHQFDLQEIGADFVMADGHKWMLGPEGAALFYSSPSARDRLSLTQYGWHMVETMGVFEQKEWTVAKSARRFECGSSNMLGIHALQASLSLLTDTGMNHIENEVMSRSEYLFDKIRTLPELELASSSENGRYAGIVVFRRNGVDSSDLYHHLVRRNVVCALRNNAIRFSPHYYTPYGKLDNALDEVLAYRS